MTPTYATVEASWSEIEAMTAQMHSAASGENWIEVIDLATKRHRDLLSHFELFPVGPDNADFYQQHLNFMLKNEAELQKVALNARKRLMSEGAELRNGHKALGAYINESMARPANF